MRFQYRKMGRLLIVLGVLLIACGVAVYRR